MNKLGLIVFAAVLCAAAAQLQCVTPPVWEGRLMEVSGNRDRFAKISYDSENNRTRIVEEVFIDQTRDFYDELFLHKEQMGYRLNLRTKECEKFKLTEPFRKIGVPSEAKLEGELYIGTSAVLGAGVMVQVYTGDTSRGRYVGEWIPVDHSCLPVSDFYFDRTTRSVSHINVFDLTLGIKDPNVFIVPPECM